MVEVNNVERKEHLTDAYRTSATSTIPEALTWDGIYCLNWLYEDRCDRLYFIACIASFAAVLIAIMLRSFLSTHRAPIRLWPCPKPLSHFV